MKKKIVKPIMDSPIDEEVVEMTGIAKASDLDYTLELIATKFGIGDKYVMTKFDDAPSKCKITLSGKDFDVQVTVKDKYKHKYPSTIPTEEEVVEETEAEE